MVTTGATDVVVVHGGTTIVEMVVCVVQLVVQALVAPQPSVAGATEGFWPADLASATGIGKD